MGSLGLRPIRTSSRYQSFGALQGNLESKRAEIAKLKTQMLLEQYTANGADWQSHTHGGGELLIR